jgi:uncharacterized metal-binding protein
MNILPVVLTMGLKWRKIAMENETPNCARCPYRVPQRLCRSENGKAPDFCPTRNMPDLVAESLKAYDQAPGLCEFAKQAAIQESEGYGLGPDQRRRGVKTRVEEIMEFSRKMNYRRLGLAFCMGLRSEAKIVEKIFTNGGFEVTSAICKVGSVSKSRLGVEKHQQVDPDAREVVCNPVLQAMIMNRVKTDFNVLLGLCVGHDSMFFKYSEAPCTVLAVKDRVLGHNPLAAVYTADSYYHCLK